MPDLTVATLHPQEGDVMPHFALRQTESLALIAAELTDGASYGLFVPTISVSTDAYTAGDCVGGIIEIEDALSIANGSVTFQSVLFVDEAAQNAGLDLYFFRAEPTASTFDDNDAAVVHADDLDKIVGLISIAAEDWATVGSVSTVARANPEGGLIMSSDSTSLWVAIVTTTTPDFSAATDLQLKLGLRLTSGSSFWRKLFAPTITVLTDAYSVGDSVGGVVEIENAVASNGGTVAFQSVLVIDAAEQDAGLDLYFFNANPSASTFTDGSTAVIHADDQDKIVGLLSIGADEWTVIGSLNTIARATPEGGLIMSSAGTSLWLAIVATTTPTFAAATDLQVKLGLRQ